MQISAPTSTQKAYEKLLDKMYISNVSKRLRELNQPTDIDRKRWIWELLQNAKDSIAHNPNRNTIKARIIIEGDVVKFQHDGDPFTADARLGLLYKYSDDKENAESTGRFGTGFLTTHCLSRKVTIESNMYGDNDRIIGFSVTMFRDGTLEKDLLEGLEKMRKSELYESDPYEWTTFTYHVNSESGRKAIKLGKENFKENIAQTLLFCRELDSVELIDNGERISIERVSETKLDTELNIVEFKIKDGDSIPTFRTFIYNNIEQSDQDLSNKYKTERSIRMQVACEIDKANKFIVSTEKATSLFCVFPLVGIENQIQMPMFINSPDFEPDSERQSLILNGSYMDEEKKLITETGINQKILSLVPDMFDKIVAYLSSSSYEGVYNLCNGLKTVKDHKSLDKEWYKGNIVGSLRSVMMKYPVVYSYTTHEQKKITDCIFVKETIQESENSLFRLIEGVYPDELVKENARWSNILWKDDNIRIWDAAEFCSDIENKENLQSLEIINGEEKLDWYNSFLSYIKAQNELLLKEHALIPNMMGDFLKVNEDNFKQGENLSETILHLLSELGEDMRPYLLHSGIYSISLDSKFNSNSFSAKVNHLIKGILETASTSLSDSDKLKKVQPLISIIISDNEKYEENFINKRRHLYRITADLFELKELSQTNDNSLNKTAWDALDIWLLNYIISSIEGKKNLSNLPKGLGAKWINDVIINLNIPLSVLRNKAIVPNQNGNFCKSDNLYFDDQIPDILKNDIFSKIGLCYKDILIDLNVDLRPLGKTNSKTIDDFATELNNAVAGSQSYRYPYTHSSYGMYRKYDEVIIREIARYLINILPKKSADDHLIVSMQKSLNKISCYFLEDFNQYDLTEISYYDSKLWIRINEFICRDIVSAIENSVSIANFMEERKNSDEYTLINNLNILYKYIESHNLNFAGKSIYLNQKGSFSKKDVLYREGEQINSLLKDIIDLIADEEDKFYNILLDSRCSVAITQSKNPSDAYNYIDGRVDTLYKNPDNWEDANFRKATHLLIDNWGDANPDLFDKSHFPKVYPIKDSISMNIIWTKSERQQLQILRSNLDASDLNELVSKIEDFKGLKDLKSRNKELEDENTRLKRELEELKGGRVMNVRYTEDDLSDHKQFEAQIEAQQKLIELRPDWSFPENYGKWNGDKPHHFSTVSVINEKQEEMPIVLKSYKYKANPFLVGAKEWEWISNGAKLFVYSHYDDGLGIREIKRDELIKKQSNFSITFESENLDIDEYAQRVSDFAEVLHYFKGLHFNFDSFTISPTAKRVQDIHAITPGTQSQITDDEGL